MVMSVWAFSRASRSTFTTLFKLGSGQVEQLQLKLSRVGRSSTRYSPLTQNSAPPSSMSIRSRPPGRGSELTDGPVVFTDYVLIATNRGQ